MRYRYELHVQSDPPVTYRLGDFDGVPISLDLTYIPLCPGDSFQITMVPLIDDHPVKDQEISLIECRVRTADEDDG